MPAPMYAVGKYHDYLNNISRSQWHIPLVLPGMTYVVIIKSRLSLNNAELT